MTADQKEEIQNEIEMTIDATTEFDYSAGDDMVWITNVPDVAAAIADLIPGLFAEWEAAQWTLCIDGLPEFTSEKYKQSETVLLQIKSKSGNPEPFVVDAYLDAGKWWFEGVGPYQDDYTPIQWRKKPQPPLRTLPVATKQ